MIQLLFGNSKEVNVKFVVYQNCLRYQLVLLIASSLIYFLRSASQRHTAFSIGSFLNPSYETTFDQNLLPVIDS